MHRSHKDFYLCFVQKKALSTFSVVAKWDLDQTCTGQKVGGFLICWWGKVVGLWVFWVFCAGFIAFFLLFFHKVFSRNHSYNIFSLSLKNHYPLFDGYDNSTQIIREVDIFLLFQLVCNTKYKFCCTRRIFGSISLFHCHDIEFAGSKYSRFTFACLT